MLEIAGIRGPSGPFYPLLLVEFNFEVAMVRALSLTHLAELLE
jgi:hypothetical protein